ncbi:DNA polymerase III subunit beta [Hyphomonas pacifica]|nr:DNA polymerase III subunit beta [Hyphomonas pacifica]
MEISKHEADGLIVTLDAAEFNKAVGRVMAAAEARSKIPILTHILIEVDPETGLSLFGTNLDMQAEAGFVPESARIDQGGRLCVDGAMIHQISGRMKGELTLIESKGRLRLVCGRAKADLPTLPAGDFQKLGDMEGAVIVEVASGALKAGLASVQHCISTEETRYYLNGIYLECGGGNLVFTATDGHRLGHLEVTASGEALPHFEGVIIPRKAVQAFLKLAEVHDGEVVLSISDRMVQLACGRDAYRTKQIDGNFPDYHRVIPKDQPIHMEVPVPDLKEALNIVVAASSDKSSAVRLTPTEGRLTLSVRNEFRQAEAVIEHDDIPPAEPFGLNGKYLQQALDRIDAPLVKIGMTDAATPFRFEAEGSDLLQVIMTLRA